MVTGQTELSKRSVDGSGSSGGPFAALGRSTRLPAVLAFAGAAALILIYSLRGSGSYDLVVFEEDGLAIWWVLALGFALGLMPRRRPARQMLMLLTALGLYAAWTALSLTWTQSAELTTVELARSLDYLGLVALFVCVLDRDTWRPAAAGLACGALLVCAVAVGSRLAPSIFGHDVVDATLHIDRLSAPFGYWNSVGALGAMCTAIGLAWSAHETSRARRALVLASVPVASLTTYLTYSRAGVGGIAVAFVAVVLLSRNRITALIHASAAAAATVIVILAVRAAPAIARGTGTRDAMAVLGALAIACAVCAIIGFVTSVKRLDRWRPRISRTAGRQVVTVLVLVLVICLVVVGPRLVSSAWHSFKRTPSLNSSTDQTARLSSLSGSRYPVWRAALHSFEAHPVEGTGAGTFRFYWNQHATNRETLHDVHNIWLQNMTELGVPGLILIGFVAASVLAIGAAARRRARRALSAGVTTAFLAVFIVYLLQASVDWMWESTAVTALALSGVAILGTRLSHGLAGHLRGRGRVALALAATVAGLLQLPGLLSTAEIHRSQSAARSGDLSVALGWANGAVSAEPWSASAHQQRGLVLESAGELEQAAHEFRVAISDEPLDYQHWLLLARVETERGQVGAAVRDYNRARQLGPRATVFAAAPPVTVHP